MKIKQIGVTSKSNCCQFYLQVWHKYQLIYNEQDHVLMQNDHDLEQRSYGHTYQSKEETSTIYLVVTVQSCEAWPKYLPYNVADTIAIIIICVCVNKFGYKIIQEVPHSEKVNGSQHCL